MAQYHVLASEGRQRYIYTKTHKNIKEKITYLCVGILYVFFQIYILYIEFIFMFLFRRTFLCVGILYIFVSDVWLYIQYTVCITFVDRFFPCIIFLMLVCSMIFYKNELIICKISE
jgi:hypothetical protein